MPKTIHRREYRTLLQLLKNRRLRAQLTQAQVSARLGRHQSYVSDVERGVRRLDIVQLRDICTVLKGSLVEFVREYERELARAGRRKP
jgi:transcriptional regulator with XRE-family HTH domain